MKKMLMFIAVAAVAIGANAASMAWGGFTLNSNNTTPGWEGYANEGTVYNLVWLGTDSITDTSTTYNKSTGLTDLGGDLVATHTITEAEANEGQFLDTVEGRSADLINGYWQVIVFDAQTPNVYDSIVYQVSGVTETSGAFDAVELQNNAGLGNSMGGSVTEGGGGGIPEPTSGLLLLIGGSLLALRRKQK